MKFKKICLSTQLSDLYGRDGYQSHVEEGREYWGFFFRDSKISEGWYKIKITYIRSGCMFYVLSDLPEVEERFCPLNCFMASVLVFAEINPTKDLKDFGSEIDKKLYCFDTEHTIVHNWSNENEIDIDESDEVFPIAYVLCKEIKD